LAEALQSAENGTAVVWNPGGELEEASLGCAQHPLGDQHFLLVMRELSNKNRELTRRLHQQRLELTGRLVASIVHDLRAPLASIVFSGEVLTGRQGQFDANEVMEMVGDIVDSARRLRMIVDGLLGFARLEPSNDTVSYLDEVFDRVSGLLRPVLREHGHTLRTYVAPGARRVKGNALLVEQIIVNLVLNAAEASSKSVRVHVSASVEPGTDGRVRVLVADDGPGIPAAVRTQVFQPFFTTKSTGTGLGLTTARESARELGGDLVLDTALEVVGATPNRNGARFSLYLPFVDGGGAE